MNIETEILSRGYLNTTQLRTLGGQLRLTYNEPCTWSLRLDNSEQTYNADQPIANPRTLTDTVSIQFEDEVAESTWTSPDLLVEDYDYNTDVVTVSGRCKLAKLDVDDQGIDVGDGTATLEDSTVAAALALIGAEVGLTFSGAPTRVIRGPIHLVGNLLQLVLEILGPTHVIRMGSGNTVLVESSTTHSTATALTDNDDLEILTYRRTSYIYNKATVERIVETTGRQVLFQIQASGGELLGPTPSPIQSFVTPSRNFQFIVLSGYRGVIDSITLRDDEGDPVGGGPFSGLFTYVGNDVVHGFTYVYTESDDADTWGVPWTPNVDILVIGYPSSVDPVPEVGYSETATAGAGNRPYPDPFSSLSVDTAADAQAMAQALVDRGTRDGNILNLAIRHRVDFPIPNQEVPVTDFLSGIDESPVIEATTIDWDESSDTGTITLEGTISEAA